MEREQRDWLSRSARRRVSFAGTATRADGSSLRVLVSNLSYEGCNLLCDKRLDRGEIVDVTVPGLGTMSAQVRWIAEERAGLSFLLGKSMQEERRARLGF
jgi:PilZ domain